MAKKKNIDPALAGLPAPPVKPAGFDEGPPAPFRLTPEMKSRLEAMGPRIERAKKEIALMKKMKMDVAEAEAELLLAESRRDIMLKNFG